MQNTLLTLAGAVIVAFVAALVGPWLVDWNARKPWLETEARRLFDADIRLNGPVQLHLLPVPSLRAEQVAVETPGGAVFTAQVAEGEISLFPLLRGQIVFGNVRLMQPTLTAATAQIMQGGALPQIETFVLEQGRLMLKNSDGSPSFTAEKISAQGSSTATILRLDGQGEVGGTPLQGQVTLSSGRDAPSLKLHMRLAHRTEPVRIETEATLAPVLSGPVIVTGGGSPGQWPWRIAAQLEGRDDGIAFAQMEGHIGPQDHLIRFTGDAKRASDGAVTGDLVARVADLDALGQTTIGAAPLDRLKSALATLPSLSGAASLRDVSVTVESATLAGATLTDIRLSLAAQDGRYRLSNATARLPGESQITASGAVQILPSGAFSGPISLTSRRPLAFLAYLEGRGGAPSPVDPITLEGELSADPARLRLANLRLNHASGAARGSFALEALPSGRNQMQIDLGAEMIDLDPLAALLPLVSSRIDDKTDATVRIALAKARLGALAIEQARADLDLSALALTVRELDFGRINGGNATFRGSLNREAGFRLGRLQGQIKLDEPALALDAIATHLPNHALLRFLGGRATLLRGLDVTGALTLGETGSSLGVEGVAADGTVKITGELPLRGQGEPRFSLIWTQPDAGGLLSGLAGRETTATTAQRPGTVTIEARPGSGGQWQGEAALQIGASEARLTGTFDPADGALEGRFGLASGNLGEIAPMFGLADQHAGAGTARLDGHLAIDSHGDGSMALDGTLADRPLRLAGQIGGGTFEGFLDAGRLSRDVVRDLVFGLQGEASPLRPIWAALPGRIDLQITTDELSLPGFAATKARAHLLLERDRLLLDGIEAKGDGADLSGSLSLQKSAAGLSLSATGKARGLALEAPHHLANGRSDVDFALTGSGATRQDMITSLTGTLTATSPALTLAGLAPEALDRLRRAAEGGQDLGKPLDEAGLLRRFRLEVAAAQTFAMDQQAFSVRGGTLRAPALRLSAPTGTVQGNLTLDLAGEALRFDGRIGPSDGGPEAAPPVQVSVVRTGSAPADYAYGIEDYVGWLALRLVDREEERVRLATYDRTEAVFFRRRLDAVRTTARPVTSPNRFLPPRPDTGPPVRRTAPSPIRAPAVSVPQLPSLPGPARAPQAVPVPQRAPQIGR